MSILSPINREIVLLYKTFLMKREAVVSNGHFGGTVIVVLIATRRGWGGFRSEIGHEKRVFEGKPFDTVATRLNS